MTGGRGAVTEEDLRQTAFFALVAAAMSYDENAGASFLSWFALHLKKEFSVAAGETAKKWNDPLNTATSLNAPAGEDYDETLLDLIPDTRDDQGEAEDLIYNEQLRNAIASALSEIPQKEAAAVRAYYLENMTLREVAKAEGVSLERARQRVTGGLRALRRIWKTAGLNQFLDANTDFYKSVGIVSFNQSRERPIETKAIKREALAYMYERHKNRWT